MDSTVRKGRFSGKGSERGSRKGLLEGGFQKVPGTPLW